MSASAASADSRLRQACGGRARRSVPQRTRSSTPQSFTAPRTRLARDYALSRRTVMKSAGCPAAEKGSLLTRPTPARRDKLFPVRRSRLAHVLNVPQRVRLRVSAPPAA